ncbi:hypothetical protein OHA70_15330 [Kribbella sp. NBC_00382]|uniref:hypothetical protein n=1 Tax=Kribbella sp. NBC_00382 TaxID=2975967 RepID=UPI002E1FAD72
MFAAMDGLAENLLAAAIGGGLAWGWRIARKRAVSKDVRAMWGPFLTENSCIVQGSLSAQTLSEDLPGRVPAELREQAVIMLPHVVKNLAEQEPSGLMGKGDHEAIVRVQAGLAKAGRRRMLPVRSDDNLGDSRSDNLIVVGGLDVNEVTNDLLGRLRCSVTIARDEFDRNYVEDLVHRQRWSMTPSEKDTWDYGIVVRAPSPYQKGKYVVVLAGASGYGCMAAADVAVNATKRMADLSREHPHGFECIVSYHRTGDAVSSTETSEIVLFRELR